jgi:shikimate kinase
LAGLQAGCEALRTQEIAPIAIGGLRLEDASACFSAGAEAVAMVSEIHRSADPANLGWDIQRLRWRVRPPFDRRRGLVLLGGSGAGKSTLGKLLAEGLDLPFLDLDLAIETRAGRPIAELFASGGETLFRQMETDLLPELLQRPAVLALGGGAWEAPVNRARIARSDFSPLWLAETPSRAWARAGQDPTRPLAQDRATFLARWAQRMPAWSQAPVVLPFGRSARDLATIFLESLD